MAGQPGQPMQGALRDYTSGTVIFKEGDPGNGMYILKSGLVQISVVLNQSDQIPNFHCSYSMGISLR